MTKSPQKRISITQHLFVTNLQNWPLDKGFEGSEMIIKNDDANSEIVWL